MENGDHIRLYYHMDYLGTADYLTSPVSGKVEAWTHYNEWGLIVHNAVLKCGQRELDLVKRYATHDYDSVLELYYAKARMYDAGDRRFTAMDPVKGNIFEPMSMVQYLYALDNPSVLIDSLGLSPYDTVRILASSARKKWFFVDSEDNATEYINVHDVWSGLSNTYKTATSKYLIDNWEFSLSDDGQSLKLVVSKNSNQGIAYYNGKNSRFSVRYDNNSVYMAKGTLLNYFKQAWSKSEHLDSKTVNTIVKVQEVVRPQEIVQNQIEHQVELYMQRVDCLKSQKYENEPLAYVYYEEQNNARVGVIYGDLKGPSWNNLLSSEERELIKKWGDPDLSKSGYDIGLTLVEAETGAISTELDAKYGGFGIDILHAEADAGLSSRTVGVNALAELAGAQGTVKIPIPYTNHAVTLTGDLSLMGIGAAAGWNKDLGFGVKLVIGVGIGVHVNIEKLED